MAKIVLTLSTGASTAAAVNLTAAYGADKRRMLNRMIDLCAGAASGNFGTSCSLLVDDRDAVAASGTLTLTSAVANDTCSIGGITFTAKVSPSGNNQFALGASDTTAAAALAAKINAHPSLLDMVTATSALGVVTITAAHKGAAANGIDLVGSADIVASAAHLAGGTVPTANSFTLSGK